MSRQASSETNLQALLEGGKELPRVPDAARDRVLARARATAASPLPLPAPVDAPRSHLPRYVTAPAMGGVVAGGIVATLVAFGGRFGGHEPAASTPASTAPAATGSLLREPVSAAEPAAPSVESPKAPLAKQPDDPRRSNARGMASTAELELMRSAHNAYAEHDYANALVLIAEHAHRFPGGILAEEREALRVRCLLGSGRTSEARRAATAFAKRFPRSVLLQRLQAEVGANNE